MGKFYKRSGNIRFLKKTEYVFVALILAFLIVISGFSKHNNNKINGNWWSCVNYTSIDSNDIYVEYYYVDDSISASYDVIAGFIMSYYRVEGDTIVFYDGQYIISKLLIKEITPEKLVLESPDNYSITMHKLKYNINVSKLLSNQSKLQEEFVKDFFLRRDSLKKNCNGER